MKINHDIYYGNGVKVEVGDEILEPEKIYTYPYVTIKSAEIVYERGSYLLHLEFTMGNGGAYYSLSKLKTIKWKNGNTMRNVFKKESCSDIV